LWSLSPCELDLLSSVFAFNEFISDAPSKHGIKLNVSIVHAIMKAKNFMVTKIAYLFENFKVKLKCGNGYFTFNKPALMSTTTVL